MRPSFETVVFEHDASWSFAHRRVSGGIPFYWHYHPEYELTLTLNSCGYRYIGDDVSEYGDADLVLLGAGIPHSWRSVSEAQEGEGHEIFVIKFSQIWLDRLLISFPDIAEIKRLFDKSFQALSFSGAVCHRVIALILGRLDQPHSLRFVSLLELALDRSAQPVGVTTVVPKIRHAKEAKVIKALNYLHENFHRGIKVAEIANVACLSASGFQRMFKRHTKCCPINYLMNLRVVKACMLLTSTDLPVGWIASSVGYTNMSLFNRQFFKLKNETPRAFRGRHEAQ